MSAHTGKRPIVRDVITYEEKVSTWGRSYNWSRTEVHTITPECGHVQVRRGRSPSTYVVCKLCRRGVAVVPIVGETGVIDKRERKVKDPIAGAFINKLLRDNGHES